MITSTPILDRPVETFGDPAEQPTQVELRELGGEVRLCLYQSNSCVATQEHRDLVVLDIQAFRTVHQFLQNRGLI